MNIFKLGYFNKLLFLIKFDICIYYIDIDVIFHTFNFSSLKIYLILIICLLKIHEKKQSMIFKLHSQAFPKVLSSNNIKMQILTTHVDSVKKVKEMKKLFNLFSFTFFCFTFCLIFVNSSFFWFFNSQENLKKYFLQQKKFHKSQEKVVSLNF